MSTDTVSGQTERFAKDLLDRAREEISYAENKASILLAGVLAVSGGIVAAISSADWPVLDQSPYVEVPFWAAVAAAIAAITGLGASIYPRMPRAAGRVGSVAFFGDVAALESPAQLRGLLTDPAMTVLDTWVDQLWQNSVIASRKHRLIRWSIRLLGCAFLLTIVTGIVPPHYRHRDRCRGACELSRAQVRGSEQAPPDQGRTPR